MARLRLEGAPRWTLCAGQTYPRATMSGKETPIDMSEPCEHVTSAMPRKAHRPPPGGCPECVKMGSSWVHLRICLTCNHVGCCDSSPNRHATAHNRATHHPIITSGEVGETWAYCYPDDRVLQAE